MTEHSQLTLKELMRRSKNVVELRDDLLKARSLLNNLNIRSLRELGARIEEISNTLQEYRIEYELRRRKGFRKC